MITLILSLFFRLATANVAEAHAIVTATLPAPDACDAPIWRQPPSCPERVRWALQTISDRESPGNLSDGLRWVGPHRGDAHHAPGLLAKGHRLGILRGWCPWHDAEADVSTVGPHGLMFVYNAERLGVPGNCVPPTIFGLPIFSALGAMDRYLELCLDGSVGWCPALLDVMRTRDRRQQRGGDHV